MSKITVIGSINVDLTVTSDRFPKVGETIFGTGFGTYFGGKGANQALAAKRLGADVTLVGCVGDDANGEMCLKHFKEEGIDTSHIRKVKEPTGVALITVSENDNEIIVIKGANSCVSKEDVDNALNVIQESDMVILQLEIPLETVEYVLELCRKYGVKTLLNPAPFSAFPKEWLELCYFITPNETEAKQMTSLDKEEALKCYPNKMVMTHGSEGVYYHDGEKLVHVPAFKVEVVDTTGAGDTFNGGMAVGLCEGMTLSEAITLGQKASALAIGKMGAQTAMPYRKDLD